MSRFAPILLVTLLCSLLTGEAFGRIVQTVETPEAFRIVAEGHAAAIVVEAGAFPGVARAAKDLAMDVHSVTGLRPDILSAAQVGSSPIFIGTIGRSAIIDQLTTAKKIDVSPIAGKWESYLIRVVADPMPGISSALVIAGSDKRGTIFGIYDLSEQIGVSPWYWWADVPTQKHEALFIKPAAYIQGPPKVKYRGIFINDEDPAFGPWAREKFGGINSKMYAHVFELILRLRGNYLWPAMWAKAFNEDDPENPRLADEYGIVMGTSHHEPMMRAQAEWSRHKKQYGNGEWNYATNAEVLRQFWRGGLERNKSFENLITIGMRGDGDMPMVKGGDMPSNMALLEQIVADQRKIIAETTNTDVTKVPQLWALYKEVADYYQSGMRVPDEVTLLWCDDNWGNVRRLPTALERERSGGAGIYYHFDYVGGPRSYKWINTNPLPKIWEQMNLAYNYGADRIWIVNVGDLKPMEIPTEFFLKTAWDPDAMTSEQMSQFTRQWAQREFGAAHADAIADIVNKYAKYNGWRKPELLDANTFSLVNYQEADRVIDAWRAITARAEATYATLPPEYRDAFYELVLYPTKASATVAELQIATARNRLYAKQDRASTNEQAQRVRDLFAQDQQLSDAYHKVAGGKWNHMMDQPRIGYTSWHDPEHNVLPHLTEIEVPQAPSLGVAIEGSEDSWLGGKDSPKLPPFDAINQQRYPIDIFNRGREPFDFTATTDRPWIKISKSKGQVEQDQRLWASIDWASAPVGASSGVITISRGSAESVAIQVQAVKSSSLTRETVKAFGGLTGPIPIDAEGASRNVAVANVRWERIPDYGRGVSGMTIFPVTARSVNPPQDSPHLEYPVLVAEAGEVQVDLITGPTLNFVPGRGLRVGVSFDDNAPQIIDAFAGEDFANPSKRPDSSSPAIRDWSKWVRDNARTLESSHTVSEPGVHTLKIWMVDPALVIEKLVVHHNNDLRPSYFGPPTATEMPR